MARDRDLAAHLAHRLYAGLVAGPHHLPTVARRSGLSAELLYKLCRGEREVLARHLPGIYRGTEDLTLFAELVSAPDLRLRVVTAEASSPASDLRDAALRVSSDAGDLARLTVEVLKDGRVDATEGEQLEGVAEELIRAGEALLELARRARGGGVRAVK